MLLPLARAHPPLLAPHVPTLYICPPQLGRQLSVWDHKPVRTTVCPTDRTLLCLGLLAQAMEVVHVTVGLMSKGEDDARFAEGVLAGG